jgi:hypothetical protein
VGCSAGTGAPYARRSRTRSAVCNQQTATRPDGPASVAAHRHGIVRTVTAPPERAARTTSRVAAMAGLLVPALVLATACTTGTPAGSGLPPIGGAPAPAPPAPPAACLLDTDALAAGTGLSWTADVSTASDTRCVYDPGPGTAASAAPASSSPALPSAGPSPAPPSPAPVSAVPAAGSPEFLAVGLAAPSAKPAAAQLDVLAQPCSPGSRKPTKRDGFVCRFPAGSVFAGRVRADQVVTIAASAVPAGTTGDALATALGQQLDALR